MSWIERAPQSVTSLSEALPHCLTSQARTLAAYYGELLAAEGGRIPEKNAFDLRRLASVLPDVALVAIEKPDRCIYRVSGERLKQRIGLNPTGRNYYDFVPPARRERAAAAMHMVIDQPLAFRAEIEQRYASGACLLIEALAVPLISAEPAVDGFILFVDRQVSELDLLSPEEGVLLGANVRRRDLIDLGHGIDESFVDLVQPD